MKIRQVLILHSKDCNEGFYSFQESINTNLARFCKDSRKSEVKIEFCSPETVIISYLQDVPFDDVDSF